MRPSCKEREMPSRPTIYSRPVLIKDCFNERAQFRVIVQAEHFDGALRRCVSTLSQPGEHHGLAGVASAVRTSATLSDSVKVPSQSCHLIWFVRRGLSRTRMAMGLSIPTGTAHPIPNRHNDQPSPQQLSRNTHTFSATRCTWSLSLSPLSHTLVLAHSST